MKNLSLPLVFAVVACTTTATPAMPSYLLDASFEIGMARTVADSCTKVSYQAEDGTARQQAVAEQFVAEGRSADELQAWQSSDEYEAWARERTVAYLEARGVDPNANIGASEEEACKLADDEIAANSGVGKLLKKVK